MQVLSLDTSSGSILVPVSMVAQIVNRSEITPLDHPLTFIESGIRWQGMTVPLVHSSEMLGDEPGTDKGFARAVILWPLEGRQARDLFALSSLGSPSVVELDDGLKAADTGPPDDRYVLQSVNSSNGNGIIADLGKLSLDVFETR